MADLAAGDVTLKVDGRPRDIRSFQFVRLGDFRSPTRPRAPAKLLPPPFGTNALDDSGRTVVIILETDSIRANVAQQATGAAAEFVAGLSPRDRVGLVTMPYGGVLVEPTRDHERVLKVLPTITGQASQQTTDSAKGCRTRDTLSALADHFAGLADIEGPKTIIFVSSGMMLPRRDAPMSGPPGPCELRSVHYDEVGRTASLARAHVYVVKPDDFVIDSAKNVFVDPAASRFRSSDDELAGIESLAGVTNGVLLRLKPSDRSAFARIARESAGYYLVGFEPKPNKRNGASHRVEFNVERGGTRVKALPAVVISRADGKKPALTPQAMLRDGKTYPDLPLRVVAMASPNPGDTKLTVVALLEPLDRSVTLESAAFGLIDQRGRLVAQWTANARELASLPAASAGLASPGRYRLRVAAIDTTGRRGSTDYENLGGAGHSERPDAEHDGAWRLLRTRLRPQAPVHQRADGERLFRGVWDTACRDTLHGNGTGDHRGRPRTRAGAGRDRDHKGREPAACDWCRADRSAAAGRLRAARGHEPGRQADRHALAHPAESRGIKQESLKSDVFPTSNFHRGLPASHE